MLRLTDTRTRQLEDVAPTSGRTLTLYACGPTVYRYQHVGNLRTFVLGSVLFTLTALSVMGCELVADFDRSKIPASDAGAVSDAAVSGDDAGAGNGN